LGAITATVALSKKLTETTTVQWEQRAIAADSESESEEDENDDTA